MIETTHPRWLLRAPLAFLALASLCAAAGAIYQVQSLARDRRAHPMPGQLVDIGGYKLHIFCEGARSPTVVLDSGLGDSFISWEKVQPAIATFARVCSYDRGGLGYSDSSPRSRTAKIFAEELHELLRNAQIAPPYVLVGHSMAGFDVRLFASLYPNEVAGMVLVDASHPEQERRFPPALNDLNGTWMREQEFLTLATPFGIPRLLGFCAPEPEVRAAECNFHSQRESLAEIKSFRESAAQAAKVGSLDELPLAVLSSDPNHPEPDLPEDLVDPTHKAWQQMQDELVLLSTRGTHTIAQNSGHYVQIDRPDVVIDAVRVMVEESKPAPERSQPERSYH